MNNQRVSSVWDAIEHTPEDAENMKLRSALMMALKTHVTRSGMDQAQAAKLFQATQQQVYSLMHGKITLFDLGELVRIATAANLRVDARTLEAARQRS